MSRDIIYVYLTETNVTMFIPGSDVCYVKARVLMVLLQNMELHSRQSTVLLIEHDTREMGYKIRDDTEYVGRFPPSAVRNKRGLFTCTWVADIQIS